MTDLARILLAVAGVAAVFDWLAVARHLKPLEYVCKPATLAALTAAAVALDPADPARRVAFVVALTLSLAGDVFLMLLRDRFVQGLSAFLGAHLAYIAGMRIGDTSAIGLAVGAAGVFLVAATVGTQILRAVRTEHPKLALPVSLYIAVISVMVATAAATQEPLVVVGALLFYLSDALIAWNRFVLQLAWAPLTIIVTYHLAQACLVLSLA